jgi:ribosomal protein L33
MANKNAIKLECKECGTINYFEPKNANIKVRLEKSKFCKNEKCKGHTMHKETK